jgi:glycosidase
MRLNDCCTIGRTKTPTPRSGEVVTAHQKAAAWRIPAPLQTRILDHLTFLYGAGRAKSVWQRLEALLRGFYQRNPALASLAATGQITERDAFLITYGDQFQEPGIPPLQTLYQVLVGTLDRPISGVHILPFFPYSSDDGFSVIDYARVNPEFGTWADVERLGGSFCLMFDAVLNHVSRHSEWFQRFLAGDPEYADWFIAFEPDSPADWVSQVTRPRALPLLTPAQTAHGLRLVWTTFSDDQIDLNYAHPPVLLDMLETLLFYVEKGARVIRLDAIAYLWKEVGTSCIHLEQTHRVVKLMRCVLDAVAPGAILITETNVPHRENVSYFGTPLPEGGTDEAQLVYQFPLPPLVMHSLLTGNACALSAWASGLEVPSQAAFFNFTASHDGIGVMPARGLLTEAEIQSLVDATLAHGGRVSYRTNPDGSRSVYELNISYFDALSDPAAPEPAEIQIARFVASQAIMLSLVGVPGIYIHSLIGSRSWQEGVAQTGHNRTINRQKLDRADLERELADPASLRSRAFVAYRRLLRARASDSAFHPYGDQQVLFLDEAVFALLRTSPDGDSQVLCLHNLSDQTRRVPLRSLQQHLKPSAWQDLLSGKVVPAGGRDRLLSSPPYAVHWLKPAP